MGILECTVSADVLFICVHVYVNIPIGKKMCILLEEGQAVFLRGIWKYFRYWIKENRFQPEKWQEKWSEKAFSSHGITYASYIHILFLCTQYNTYRKPSLG